MGSISTYKKNGHSNVINNDIVNVILPACITDFCEAPIWSAGSLLHSMIEHNMALVGASAGAFALVGAHLAVVITVSQREHNLSSVWSYRKSSSSWIRVHFSLGAPVSSTCLSIYLSFKTRSPPETLHSWFRQYCPYKLCSD